MRQDDADGLTWRMHGCRETVRLIKRLHQYDVMRANKAPFAFGLEPRVPFLDKEFLDISMTLDPADKMVSIRPGCKALCAGEGGLPCMK